MQPSLQNVTKRIVTVPLSYKWAYLSMMQSKECSKEAPVTPKGVLRWFPLALSAAYQYTYYFYGWTSHADQNMKIHAPNLIRDDNQGPLGCGSGMFWMWYGSSSATTYYFLSFLR